MLLTTQALNSLTNKEVLKMETIAKFELEGMEPVSLSYSTPEYFVEFNGKRESFDFFDEAQDCFKDFVSESFDLYR